MCEIHEHVELVNKICSECQKDEDEYVIHGTDYAYLINLANDIIHDKHVDDRFTDAHKQVLQVFVDNWDDYGGERELFKTMGVCDFYYQCATSDDDINEVPRPVAELVEMFWNNIDDEIKYVPKKACVSCGV